MDSTFDFDDLRAEVAEAGIDLTFIVRNIGSRCGKVVPQIHITYPSDAGERLSAEGVRGCTPRASRGSSGQDQHCAGRSHDLR
jgi:hypothetical protein